ncbi:MAG TPA: ribonuclease P protein component, partial [Steroidobacteraceae bacterium]|nr:ribonuclease P protein component [Steroidobacteraceae bacterium]
VGNAVSRNRVKRTVRESFRLHRAELPGVDLVVGARALARSAHNARLRESLADLWKKIAKQCAASSAE